MSGKVPILLWYTSILARMTQIDPGSVCDPGSIWKILTFLEMQLPPETMERSTWFSELFCIECLSARSCWCVRSPNRTQACIFNIFEGVWASICTLNACWHSRILISFSRDSSSCSRDSDSIPRFSLKGFFQNAIRIPGTARKISGERDQNAWESTCIKGTYWGSDTLKNVVLNIHAWVRFGLLTHQQLLAERHSMQKSSLNQDDLSIVSGGSCISRKVKIFQNDPGS